MIAAIDCDLRTSYLVTDSGLAVRGPNPGACLAQVPILPDAILFEVASPLDYTDDKAIAYNKRRWTIWNIAQAARLHAAGLPLLVAPSHAWTKGFSLEVRHLMAKCKQPKKDLREAEAMMFFYRATPGDWVDFPTFLARL